MSNDTTKATVLDIQRLSTEDGPGLRTTVFFKGCNLRCEWCHNPESLVMRKQLEWHAEKCIRCRMCEASCPEDAIAFDNSQMLQIDRDACTMCEICSDQCPTLALEVKGVDWTLDELVYEVLKDRNYFGPDGGVTVSGGESLLQADFVVAFLQRLHEEGIHTAVDTAGHVPADVLDSVMPYTDMVLYDIKIFDDKLHKKYTGVGNDLILKNAQHVAEISRSNSGKPEIWIRTPIIPGISDSVENIEYIGKYIKEYLEMDISRWELLAFNNLCQDKYDRLDMDWTMESQELMEEEQMKKLFRTAISAGVRPEIVMWSGATKLEDE